MKSSTFFVLGLNFLTTECDLRDASIIILKICLVMHVTGYVRQHLD